MTPASKIYRAVRRVLPVAGMGPAFIRIEYGLVPDLATANFAVATMFDHPELVQIESISEEQ